MKRIGAALSLAAGLVWMATEGIDASCRVAVVRHHNAVVVATPVFAASYVPYAVPTYGVSYSGGSQEALIKLFIEQHRALTEEVKAMRQEMNVLRSGGGIGPLKNPGDDIRKRGEDALRANCAMCHDSATAKGKGTAFVMFDGDSIVKLTLKQISRMQSRMTIKDEDQMPPPKSREMSGEHFTDSMRYLRSLEKTLE